MKKILTILAIVAFAACKPGKKKADGTTYGKVIDPSGAITMADLEKSMVGKAQNYVKVEAPVEAVCQAKGCWMDLKKADGTGMKVTFKDYEFFVPKDIAGKTAIVEGVASFDTTTVEMLKHYAEDAGKPQPEIDAITTPKVELVFEAVGVIIK